MTGFDAYKIWRAVFLHFESPSYNAIKYNFKTRFGAGSYEGRRDRYFFEKISSKHQTTNDLIQFFVSNRVYSPERRWVGEMTGKNLDILRDRLSTLSYRCARQVRGFPVPFDEMFCGENPPILNSGLGIEIELQVVLNNGTNFVSDFRKTLKDPLGIYQERLNMIENYQPFLLEWVPSIRTVHQTIVKAIKEQKEEYS